MGKKCIPGVFCIENMTLFLLVFILIVLVYLYHATLNNNNNTKIVVVSKDLGEKDVLATPPQNSMPMQVPVNVETRGPSASFFSDRNSHEARGELDLASHGSPSDAR